LNLVTGATGLIGSHVVLKLLQQGKSVIAAKQAHSDTSKVKNLFSLYVTNADELFSKISWVQLDMNDVFSIEEALANVSVVYHCAGFVSFQERDVEKLIQINEIGTANLINACILNLPAGKAGKIKSFCHVSSLSTINNSDYLGELNEGVFWKTSGKESAYAISKYNAEREVWRGMEEGLNIAIVNPGVVLGPGYSNQSSGKLFAFCKKGNLFYTDGSTGYVSAVDVAEVMVQLMDKEIYGERYILIENTYTYKSIFSLIQGAYNKPAPKIKTGLFILHLGRIADAIVSALTGKNRFLTNDIIRSATGHKKFSNKKIIKALSFTFTPINKVISDICSQHNN